MTIAIGSGLTSITGNVSVTATNSVATPSTAQTIINISATGSGANQDAYTTTTGKTFLLYGVWITGGAAMTMDVYKNDGTTLLIHLEILATSDGQQVFSPVPLWGYQSTEIVKVKTTLNRAYGFWGVEQ